MSETNSPISGKRILLVEDDHEIVSIIQQIATMVGFEIDCCNTGAEALALFSTSGADVVLIDLMLHDLNGIEVARQIRSHPNGNSPHLVLMSGAVSNETRAQAEPFGFALILEKPVAVPDLVQILKQLTESSN